VLRILFLLFALPGCPLALRELRTRETINHD